MFYLTLVGNEQLQGKTNTEAAQVQQWIDFGDHEILPASCTWVFPCLGITQYNKQVYQNVQIFSSHNNS